MRHPTRIAAAAFAGVAPSVFVWVLAIDHYSCGRFGLLSMSTSFLAVGLAIKEMFKFDYNLKNTHASLWTCVIPFIIALFIIFQKVDHAFYKVLNYSGALFYPLTSVLIVYMFWHAKKKGKRKPEYSLPFGRILGAIIILLFLAGFVNEIWRFFI